MLKGRVLSIGGLAAFLLLGGCSLAIETEAKQCKNDDDCMEINGAYPQTCNPAGVCVLKEGLQCETAAACVEEEGKPFCDNRINRCVSKAICKEDAECSDVFGLKSNICEGGVCRAGDCKQPKDCEKFGEGFECLKNRCQDPVWGCLGEPDDREMDGSEGIFRMKVLFGPADTDTPVKDIRVTVCRSGDFTCTNPEDSYTGVDTDTIQYDSRDGEGWLTIRNLQNGARYNLLIEAKSPLSPFASLLPGKFMMHRPIVGMTEEIKPMVMFLSFIRDRIGSSSGITLNGNGAGLLFARLFDCKEDQLPGAVINLSKDFKTCKVDDDFDPETPDVDCATTVFYFDGGNQPLKDAEETDSAGRAGAINMYPDTETVVRCHKGSDSSPYTEMAVIPPAGWITYTNIYPREF